MEGAGNANAIMCLEQCWKAWDGTDARIYLNILQPGFDLDGQLEKLMIIYIIINDKAKLHFSTSLVDN